MFCHENEDVLADFHSRLSGAPTDIQPADDLDSVFDQANKPRTFSFNPEGTQCEEATLKDIEPSVSYVLYENNELKIVMQCEATRQMRNDMFITVLKMTEKFSLPQNLPIIQIYHPTIRRKEEEKKEDPKVAPVTIRRMESHYASLDGISAVRVKQSVVREDKLVEQEESQFGVFFSGDCYVVQLFY